jgi:hypothetical protein
MITIIKWIALCVVFAIIAIQLYIAIDSTWAEKNNASMLVTIGFFMAAVATILCGIKAIESKDSVTRH